MATVQVACKLPNGFIMELITKGDMLHPAPRGLTVKIAGANSLAVKGTNPEIGQFAFTTVDKALADEWFLRNKDLAFVKNKSVFVHESVAGATGGAKEHAELRTGIEPLLQDNDPRMPKSVEPDKDQLRRLGSAA